MDNGSEMYVRVPSQSQKPMPLAYGHAAPGAQVLAAQPGRPPWPGILVGGAEVVIGLMVLEGREV